MIKEEWEKIIDHQINLVLKEKGLRIGDLNKIEIAKYRFEMALKLLEELG